MVPFAARGRPILWVLALALLLRLALFFVVAPHPDRFYSVDARDYVALGTDLREAYGAESGPLLRSALFRPPGYPVVIAAGFAATGGALWGLILIQIAAGVLTVWLTYLLALRLIGPQAALWAGFALAIDPISIILANYLQPETLFTLLLVGGTLMWLRATERRSFLLAAGAGALMGMNVLLRSVGLYLPAVLLPASWILHGGRLSRRLIFCGVFLLAFTIPVGGWIARNAAVTGVPVFSTGEGINLLYYRAAAVRAESEGISFEAAQQQLMAAVKRTAQPGMNPAEVSKLERSLALEIIREHPVATLKTLFKSTLLMMTGPGRAELLHLLGDLTPTRISGTVQILLIGAEILVYGVILIGALAACYLLFRQRRFRALFVPLILILYFVLASLATTPHSRYRVPIMPFIAVLAGAAFARWWKFPSRVPDTLQDSTDPHPSTSNVPGH